MANNNRKKKNMPASTRSTKCPFQMAVESTEEVKTGYRPGLHAIKKSDRNKVNAMHTNKIQGSLDIDTQVQAIYPNKNRWDYVLSYNNRLYFFEIHSAETSEVKIVIDKINWLKYWLKVKASNINALPKAEHPYIWIQSGRYAILPGSKEMMKLSIAGITTTNRLNLK